MEGRDNDLSNLPTGLVEFGGVPFDVRGVIRLRATHPTGYPFTLIWDQYPARVQGIKIEREFAQLHVLQGAAGGRTRQPVSDGTPIARFTYHYADGTQRTDDLIYGRDVRDWWEHATDRGPTERGHVVWRGTNAVASVPNRFAGPDGANLRLYLTTWTHRQPDAVVTHLDYESLLTACGPFLVAITVE